MQGLEITYQRGEIFEFGVKYADGSAGVFGEGLL